MKPFGMLFILSVLLTGCTTVTSTIYPTATASLLLMASPTFTPTFTLASAPTETPSTSHPTKDFSLILYRRYLSRFYQFQVIGGVQNGEWLTSAVVADQVRFEQSFDIYAPDGFTGVAVTKDYSIPLVSVPGGEIFIGSDFSKNIPNLIGVAQGWGVTYRPSQELSVNAPVYQQVVRDWLISQNISDPDVRISRILRVDLEGDGVDEVLISASRFIEESGHMTEAGDYSIILMRKVMGNEVVTVPVIADIYTSSPAELTFPFTYSLANLLDLNRDGILELIVELTRWEGNGVMIFEVEGGSTVQVIKEISSE